MARVEKRIRKNPAYVETELSESTQGVPLCVGAASAAMGAGGKVARCRGIAAEAAPTGKEKTRHLVRPGFWDKAPGGDLLLCVPVGHDNNATKTKAFPMREGLLG
jgi:hypothetical protein